MWTSASASHAVADHRQCHAVQAGGLLVGQHGGRLVAGPLRVLDRLSSDLGIVRGSAVRATRGLDEVEGQLSEVLAGRGAVHLLELTADASVEPHAATGWELVVQGLANQVVREAIAAAGTRNRRQKAGLDGLVDHVERLVTGNVTDPRQGVQAELRAEGRPEAQRVDRGTSEVADPPGDHGVDAGRDGHPQLVGAADVIETPLGREQADGLADEQRVAVRRTPHGGGDAPGRRGARRGADHLRDRVGFEPAEPDQADRGFAGELGDRRRQRVSWRQLDVAVGADDEEVHLADLAGEELEQQDRRRVGRLQVVEDDHNRALAGGIAEECRGGIEQLEAGNVRVGGPGREVEDDRP